MGSFFTTIKRFFANKNTVTIFGVLAGVIVLWYGYSYRVNSATTPIKVPIAIKEIGAQEEIVQDNIDFVEINSKFISKVNIYTNVNDVKGKYVNIGTSIPAGGLFYKEQVVTKDKLPKTMFDSIPDGFTLYPLKVNNHSTYGNKIFPGTKIDLFMKYNDEQTKKTTIGCLVSKIDVIGVVDNAGKDVFSSTDHQGTPSYMYFALPDDDFNLLKGAEYINGVEIFPIPRNEKYTQNPGETAFKDQLSAYIKSKVYTVTGTVTGN